ncbi:hypothetical protein FLJC2902T_10190 [Flavobacterium limnosediminis JC2902]|uniref:Uncharacterized protein n=1 Tax=Flavobacterium limnosediminis JC2902 TaxID=1341181 RepID=V6SQR4_9FLAO|nr:hypothetical protein FLJC2902T_10190 [Flavobacterium limnosediminis JC2902]
MSEKMNKLIFKGFPSFKDEALVFLEVSISGNSIGQAV